MGLFDFFKKKDSNNGHQQNERAMLDKTDVEPGLLVPKAFAAYWTEIGKTRLPFIAIKATPSNDLALEQSKFGHYPRIPADLDYPKDTEGRPMYPLAQINFKEMPKLEGYPTSGYLQFYIAGFDDAYGMNFEQMDKQENFRVLFFEEEQVQQHKTDFSFLDEVMTSDEVPVNKPHALTFEAKNDYIGMNDVRYSEKSSFKMEMINEKFPSISDELDEAAYECFSSNGHKIGGYAYFTQVDPREDDPKFGDYILLFQLDTDEEIMWGDAGVANFFIHPDDLAKKDFSKVMYNWDCS